MDGNPPRPGTITSAAGVTCHRDPAAVRNAPDREYLAEIVATGRAADDAVRVRTRALDHWQVRVATGITTTHHETECAALAVVAHDDALRRYHALAAELRDECYESAVGDTGRARPVSGFVRRTSV